MGHRLILGGGGSHAVKRKHRAPPLDTFSAIVVNQLAFKYSFVSSALNIAV